MIGQLRKFVFAANVYPGGEVAAGHLSDQVLLGEQREDQVLHLCWSQVIGGHRNAPLILRS